MKNYFDMILRSPDEPAADAPAADPAPAAAAPAETTLLGTDAPKVDDQPIDGGKTGEDTDKPGSEAEKEGAKEEKKKTGEPDNKYLGAPDTYDLKTPEGFEVNPEIKGEFETTAKEIGLSQEGASKLVELQGKLYARQAEAVATQITEWGKQVKGDKELGGNDHDAKMGKAIAFRDAFFTPEVKTLLDKTGLGNHPEIVRGFYRAGEAMGEAITHKGGASTGKQDAATILYGA